MTVSNAPSPFQDALRRHLADPSEETRYSAYELGRRAVEQQSGALSAVAELAGALRTELGRAGLEGDPAGLIALAGEFLAEYLAPFEMLVTGMRQSLQALQRSHEQLREQTLRLEQSNAELAEANRELALRAELLDLAHDAVIVREPAESRVSFWNREAQAVYGYSAAEAIGQITHDLLATVFPDSREAVDDALARDGHWHGELRHMRKDGSEILVASRQALQRDADGPALAIIELDSDITAQRQAENELRDSRERLAEAERVARTGSWEWDLAADHITWSDGLLNIYGLTPDEFDSSSAAASNHVYPADRELVTQTIAHAITERSAYTLEMRAIRSDGRVRTLRSQGEVVVDDTGNPIRVVGIVQDITDAKLAQEALQFTSAELERRAHELQQLALRAATEPPDMPHVPLTARQREILQLIAEGLTNAAIGERLFLTEGTVKWHVQQILTKTNTSNRAEAVARVLGTLT